MNKKLPINLSKHFLAVALNKEEAAHIAVFLNKFARGSYIGTKDVAHGKGMHIVIFRRFKGLKERVEEAGYHVEDPDNLSKGCFIRHERGGEYFGITKDWQHRDDKIPGLRLMGGSN